jgi:hypothetical protein
VTLPPMPHVDPDTALPECERCCRAYFEAVSAGDTHWPRYRFVRLHLGH